MPKHKIPLLTISWLLLMCGAASGQEKGQTGLTMAFPASVGVIFHVSDRVAIRSDVSFGVSKTSYDLPPSFDSPPFSIESSGSTVVVGVSGLFYMRKWDALTTYVSPEFSYGRMNFEVTGVQNDLLSPVTSSYSFSGSFGAQYSLSRRFGVFGETGLAYTHRDLSTRGSTGYSFGTVAGVGVIFYF